MTDRNTADRPGGMLQPAVADDLETRLGRTKFMQEADVEALCDEAAVEIKRLRAERDVERALVDRLAGALLDRPFRGGSLLRRDRMYGSDWEDVHDALDAWESHRARRDPVSAVYCRTCPGRLGIDVDCHDPTHDHDPSGRVVVMCETCGGHVGIEGSLGEQCDDASHDRQVERWSADDERFWSRFYTHEARSQKIHTDAEAEHFATLLMLRRFGDDTQRAAARIEIAEIKARPVTVRTRTQGDRQS
jgi:hypothetical protein